LNLAEISLNPFGFHYAATFDFTIQNDSAAFHHFDIMCTTY